MKHAIRFAAVCILLVGCGLIRKSDSADAETGKNQPRKVLIVTGIDYPGHKWKLTAPVLAKAISEDKRLVVTVTDKPGDLAADDLNKYDVIILHFMNWEVPDPGDKARSNLKSVIAKGKGLVLVHFACGAFQQWPEFVKIAGRVWDPNMRAHDPYGKFAVKIADPNHPAMKAMTDFETVDELYTCLTGKTPIKVLATARSKVDGKDYPMAFVLNYGKGRVFHSVLGHDVQALANPPVARLFRNACAWTAGLKPLD
ncbi:MAG: ThuA domain-containing protein [Sedimentisphaerales bacterium]|nr:ThuA domain-containing protein [Sedimentisphaerales bacterium]